MFLKTMTGKTLDMRAFHCLHIQDKSLYVSVYGTGEQQLIASLASAEQARDLYNVIVKKWAFGEDIFDIEFWVESYGNSFAPRR